MFEKRPSQPQGVVHQEVFTSVDHDGEIRVACHCPLGRDHTYSEGLKYLGPVETRRNAVAE